MISEKQIDKLFIRQKLSKGAEEKARLIEESAHQLALLIHRETRPCKATEEAIMALKTAVMHARLAIATLDVNDEDLPY